MKTLVSERPGRNFFQNIVIGLLLLEFLRVPFLAVLNLRQYGFLIHVMVLLSPILLMRGVSPSLSRSRYFVAAGIWCLLMSVVLFRIGISAFSYVTMLSSLFAPFLFVVLMDFFKNDARDWEKIVTRTLQIIFYLGSAYFIYEWIFVSKLKLVSICELASFYQGQRNDQFCNTGRYMPVGFFIYKDMSLAVLMGAFFSFVDWSNRRIVLLRFALMIASVFIVDSLTLVAIFGTLVLVKFWDELKKDLSLKILAILILANLFLLSSSYQRILDYIVHEMDINVFLPTLETCSWQNITVTLNGTSETCHSREMHSLIYLFKYGFMATAAWYISLLIIPALFLKDFIKKRVYSLLYFPLVFIANGLHYSGAESWGVNFLILGIFFLYLNRSIQNSKLKT